MEIGFIILAIIGLAAALVWDRRTQADYMARMGRAWTDAGHTLALGPFGAICHGDRPHGFQHRIYGALVLTPERLLFAGQRVHTYDLDAPPEWVRWIGVRTNIEPKGRRMFERRGLLVHLETPDGWRVYTFTELAGPEDIAQQIAAQCGLDMHDIGTAYEDFGPAPAQYVRLGPGDTWTPAVPDQLDPAALPPDWDGLACTLYLAPDRLLFDWRHPVLLAALHRVDAYPVGHPRNPFDLDLLRIEVDQVGAGPQIVGFVVDNAGDWADEIAGKVAVPVRTHQA